MKWYSAIISTVCFIWLFSNTIFDSKEDKERLRQLKAFNSVYEDYNTWIFVNTQALLEMPDETLLAHYKTLYPQYQQPILERHKDFAIVFFEGRNLLPLNYKLRRNFYQQPDTGYFVTQTSQGSMQ